VARVLLLSTTTGYQLRSFSGAAGELGVSLVFATDRCRSLDDPWQDAAVPVRFHDEDASLAAIVAAAGQAPIDGVVAVGDRPVVLAARAAEALGLAGNPPAAARASVHKRLARDAFASAGLPSPACVATTVGRGIEHVAGALAYPVVMKPVGLSGSRGVIRADDPAALRAAFERVARLLARPEIRALRTGSEDELLIERFIEGREYAVEGLLTHGAFTALAVFDKPDPLDGPFFEESIYVTPSRAGEVTTTAIVAAVARAARALGLTHGAVHAECRVNGEGVFVLEVAARPIGGLCSRVLRLAAAGGAPLSLEHLLLRHALGHDLAGVSRESCASAVMMVPIPERGVFREVRGVERASQVAHVEEVRITARPDQLLEPLPEAGSYLGFIFARAADPARAEAAVREAHACLTFVLDRPLDVRRTG
jgi:biotin carboxylase